MWVGTFGFFELVLNMFSCKQAGLLVNLASKNKFLVSVNYRSIDFEKFLGKIRPYHTIVRQVKKYQELKQGTNKENPPAGATVPMGVHLPSQM